MWRDGVRTALFDCLEIDKDDRVLIIGDRDNEDISRAFWETAKERSRAYLTFLEDYGGRPLTEFPWALKEYMEFIEPTVTLYIATVKPNELPLRKGIVETAMELQARHAHMPGIDKKILDTGLKECKNVVETTLKVYDVVNRAQEVKVFTEKGTELNVEVGKYRWIADTGKIEPGSWGNLPGGEVFTTPVKIEGTAVVDGSLGDYFKKYGKLKKPLVLKIEKSELVDVKSEDQKLAGEFWKYLSSHENGLKVGEFAIGTNVNIEEVIGNLLQDEKIPGVHIAFGDPLGGKTGAPWKSDVHVDAVITKTDVMVDGKWLMKGGRFLIK